MRKKSFARVPFKSRAFHKNKKKDMEEERYKIDAPVWYDTDDGCYTPVSWKKIKNLDEKFMVNNRDCTINIEFYLESHRFDLFVDKLALFLMFNQHIDAIELNLVFIMNSAPSEEQTKRFFKVKNQFHKCAIAQVWMFLEKLDFERSFIPMIPLWRSLCNSGNWVISKQEKVNGFIKFLSFKETECLPDDIKKLIFSHLVEL